MVPNADATEDAYNMAVANIINAEFNKQDFGHTRLAKAAGISRQSTYLYLDGTRFITVSKLRRICDALHMDIGKVVSDAKRATK